MFTKTNNEEQGTRLKIIQIGMVHARKRRKKAKQQNEKPKPKSENDTNEWREQATRNKARKKQYTKMRVNQE